MWRVDDDDGAESCRGGGSQRSREEGEALEELVGIVLFPTTYKGKQESFCAGVITFRTQ